jgi:hypothetical protein
MAIEGSQRDQPGNQLQHHDQQFRSIAHCHPPMRGGG